MAIPAEGGFAMAAWDDGGRDLGPADYRAALRRLAITYWIAIFVATTVLCALVGADPIETAPGKVVSLAFGLLLTVAMTWFLKQALALPLWQQACVAVGLSLVASPVSVAADYGIYLVGIYSAPTVVSVQEVAYNLIFSMSIFFGWCCLYLALRYSFALADGERRMAALREEALSAQMRALAYQVNPHFLFNTLNAMAGLIEEEANGKARAMVLQLSAFLRKTLSLDPTLDIPLREELALQSDYLAVESTRFSDRMKVVFSVDDEAQHVRVPPLILQPIFENAVKYGVGATKGPVEIALRAEVRNAALVVTVENDAPLAATGEPPPSMGIGLRNVKNRIATHFSGTASLSSHYVRPGRFAVSLTFPLVHDDRTSGTDRDRRR